MEQPGTASTQNPAGLAARALAGGRPALSLVGEGRGRISVDRRDRLAGLAAISETTRIELESLMALARRGLPKMHTGLSFVHTVRENADGEAVPEGDSLRYAANVASGLACLDIEEQREILDGPTAVDLALRCAARAETSDDMGAVALAAWVAAEVADVAELALLRRLEDLLSSSEPVPTVTCAWTLIAAVAAHRIKDMRKLASLAARRLMADQARSGLFPHMLPSAASGSRRAHVGCFADQVYAIMGLARLSVLEGNPAALAAADACARRICTLQGPAGQWWWHYDVRDGSVVEGYPVYSVHQQAMGPMALLDLREAGGADHMASVAKGLQWLEMHPEVIEPMICERHSVIWRKVARREPKKVVRALQAATSGIRMGFHLPGIDTLFPPVMIDRECRPYELGWLLYAWLCGGVVERLAVPQTASSRPPEAR